ncbi:MAG: nitrilase-related carbon-nitrogen hydrolase, partial [Pseudomonadota bacterium]
MIRGGTSKETVIAKTVTPYRALALQARCKAVNELTVDEARASMAAALEHTAYLIDGAMRFIGPDTRLIVLPEYSLTGFPFGESIAEWREKAALAPDGPEYDRLSEIAAERRIFLAGNAYETDA